MSGTVLDPLRSLLLPAEVFIFFGDIWSWSVGENEDMQGRGEGWRASNLIGKKVVVRALSESHVLSGEKCQRLSLYLFST